MYLRPADRARSRHDSVPQTQLLTRIGQIVRSRNSQRATRGATMELAGGRGLWAFSRVHDCR